MKKIVIIGNGSYARMMNQYLKMSGREAVCAYAVDGCCIEEPELDGIEVISLERLKDEFPCDQYDLIMGIGYVQMAQIRKRIFEPCMAWGYHFENYIHPSAIISPDANLGEGNNILEGVIVEMGVSIGNANLFFGGSIVGHESRVGDYNTFSISAKVAGVVTVGNNCFLGIGSAVKDHVTISDYVLLGATAYGFKDMEEYSVVVPAKSEILKDKKSVDFL